MTVPNEIEDAKHVYEDVAKMPGVTSVSLTGHSQGGVVASMTAGILGTQKVKSLALMAPAAVLREDAIRGRFTAQFDSLNPPAAIEMDGLKLGGNMTSAVSLMNMPILSYADEIKNAVMVLHGEKAHSRYFGEDAFKKLKGDNKELVIVPGASHVDLYDNKAKIPFDKLAAFFDKNLK